ESPDTLTKCQALLERADSSYSQLLAATVVPETDQQVSVLYKMSGLAGASRLQLLPAAGCHHPETDQQALLERADSSYSQLLAATTLGKLISRSTGSLSTQQRLDIRNYVLNYLATRPKLASFTIQALVALFARITKLSWFDMIKDEDTQLFEMFRLSCSLLGSVRGKSAELSVESQQQLIAALLKLSHNCLMFDFIGTTSDESSDDLCTVQVSEARQVRRAERGEPAAADSGPPVALSQLPHV
ncbi:Exportin-7, partial [Operophtera brumata]